MSSVLPAMEAYNDIAPAHNPPYVQAMRLLAKELPEIPLVAAFETGFHETIAPAERLYAMPLEWADKHGIKRWGFHGASHRYIAERTGQAAGQAGGEDHLVPPGRQQFAVCDPGRQVGRQQPGHEPADADCRTTTASAISIRSPCRS